MGKQRRQRRPDVDGDDTWLAVGWTSINGLLTAAEIRSIRVHCDEIIAQPQRHRPNDKIAGETQRLCELDQRIDLVATIGGRPELTTIVRHALGEQYGDPDATFRNPRPGFGGQRLHADDVPKLDAGPDRIVTAIVPLVDFTEDNGPTRVVPGSHRRPDLQRVSAQLTSHPDERFLIGEAGDAFVFSGHLLHSGTINNSDGDRPALQLIWRRIE